MRWKIKNLVKKLKMKVKSFAFCVYNKTTKIIAVIEKYGGEPKKSFREILEPEDVKCAATGEIGGVIKKVKVTV